MGRCSRANKILSTTTGRKVFDSQQTGNSGVTQAFIDKDGCLWTVDGNLGSGRMDEIPSIEALPGKLLPGVVSLPSRVKFKKLKKLPRKKINVLVSLKHPLH